MTTKNSSSRGLSAAVALSIAALVMAGATGLLLGPIALGIFAFSVGLPLVVLWLSHDVPLLEDKYAADFRRFGEGEVTPARTPTAGRARATA